MRSIILNISKFATLSVGMFALLATTSSAVVAQSFSGKAYVADSSKDHVVEITVENGVVVEGAMRILETSGHELSSISGGVAGDGELFFVDGGSNDKIVRFDLEANTMSVIAESDPELPLGTPKSLAIDPEAGTLMTADDGSGKDRILALNLASGEWKLLLDNSNASEAPIDDPQVVVRSPEGVVYVIDVGLQSILACVDLDGDGCFQSSGEVQQAFSGGIIGNVLAAQYHNGALYLGDKDTGTIRCFRDLNRDGDFVDEGEPKVAIDGALQNSSSDLRAFAMTAAGGFVFADAKADTLSLAEDADGNGTIEDHEVSVLLSDRTLLSSHSVVLLIEDVADPGPDPEPAQAFIRGDANFSETVELTDAVLVLLHLVLGQPQDVCHDALDSDDNGVIDISDPIYLLNYLFVGGGEPPAPFPIAGLDPTDDELDCASGFDVP